MKGAAGEAGLASLLGRLVEEKRRVERLLQQVDEVLRNATPPPKATPSAEREAAPRPDPLDQVKAVMSAAADIRVANGNLSAERIAKLYGISLTQLAGWLKRTKQAVSKTPDADSLQNALGYFERVARLRLLTKTDAEFRQWLRTPHELLNHKTPLDLLAKGRWQAMADYVADILTGTPG